MFLNNSTFLSGLSFGNQNLPRSVQPFWTYEFLKPRLLIFLQRIQLTLLLGDELLEKYLKL